jgi:hypothetical protein
MDNILVLFYAENKTIDGAAWFAHGFLFSFYETASVMYKSRSTV